MIKRLVIYFLGLFMLTIGISFSLKSNLGVTPLSSIPYTITLITGIEMGKVTILFHSLFILMQIVILRKDFKIKNLSQVFVAIVFGYFTTFSNYLITFLPTTENFIIRLLLLLISVIFVAFGIFLYLPSDIVPLAPDGVLQAISQKTGIIFPRVKIAFDSSMVLFSGIACLFILGGLGSVGIGTIITAVMVGITLNIIMKLLKHRLDEFLNDEAAGIYCESD